MWVGSPPIPLISKDLEGSFAMWLCSFMPSFLPADMLSYVIMMEVLRITVGTLLLTAALELLCWRHVKKLLDTKPKLYFQAIACNLFNHCVIAPMIFGPALRFYVPV